MVLFRSLRSKRRPALELRELLDRGVAQFQGLNPREPGQWPILPQVASWGLTLLAVVGAGWALVLAEAATRLEAQRGRELVLRDEFRAKLNQATNLVELRKQKLQAQEYVNQVEKQLPGRAEMDAMLSDINQSGLGRGLLFESFKPGQVLVRGDYAELPVALKVTGKYHDIGAFVADIAKLSRIVTLHDMSLTGPALAKETARNVAPDLTLEATVRTYRYVDPSETAARQTAEAAAAKGGKK
jgi:type IV pilus assembly protein PilO